MIKGHTYFSSCSLFNSSGVTLKKSGGKDMGFCAWFGKRTLVPRSNSARTGSAPSKASFKGQLISECLLDVIDFPQNQRKIWQSSALESKKCSNQQSKSTFL